eukprot:gene20635-32515_t
MAAAEDVFFDAEEEGTFETFEEFAKAAADAEVFEKTFSNNDASAGATMKMLVDATKPNFDLKLREDDMDSVIELNKNLGSMQRYLHLVYNDQMIHTSGRKLNKKEAELMKTHHPNYLEKAGELVAKIKLTTTKDYQAK